MTLIPDLNAATQFDVSQLGYYGEFGGSFIPEMLYHNVETLRKNYLKIIYKREF